VVVGKVKEVGLSVTDGIAVPVPLSDTTCGEPVAVSVMLRVAENAPAAAGLKAAKNEHEAPTASELPQLVNSSNDVGLVPPSRTELMVVLTEPEFVRVMTCASLVVPLTLLGKVIVVGLKVTEFAGTAIPLSVANCGEPVTLSAADRLAVRVPVASGLNSTETVQVAATASVVPQVVADLRKEVALVPVTVSEVRVSVPVPVFLSVTICAGEVKPSAVEAKDRLVGERVMASVGVATPLPVSAAVCGDPVALSASERLAVSVPVAAGLNSTETAQDAPGASEAVQVFAEIR
jgi:hypothetical protein